VPYGDLDVAAALDDGITSVYRLGTRLSAQTMTSLGIEGTVPLVDPLTGVLPEAVLGRVSPGSPVVLADTALPDSDLPVVRGRRVAPVVLTDTRAGSGGPAPNSQYAALAVRQRLLSEAALHALSANRDQPLVVSMPAYWNPGDAWDSSRFFAGLSRSWLRLVDLPSVVTTAPRSPRSESLSLVYPDEDRAERLPVSNLVATRTLVTTADVFDRLLTARDPVDQPLDKIAMLASSSTARPNPGLARGLAAGANEYVRAQMAAVRVEGPQFVMMSGESGPIQVTLVNGLRQSVTVGITVSTPGSDVRIADVKPVTLGAGRRTSIRLEARSDDIGVHSVTLTPSNADGVPLGTSTRLSVRTSNVSTVIWVIMAVGGALLFIAIGVRLFRRMRVRQATHGPRLTREMSA
jgi:hypothetical protein